MYYMDISGLYHQLWKLYGDLYLESLLSCEHIVPTCRLHVAVICHMLQADVFFCATIKLRAFSFLICHSVCYFFFLQLWIRLSKKSRQLFETYGQGVVIYHMVSHIRWRNSIHFPQQIFLYLYHIVCLSVSFCVCLPWLGLMPSPFPTSLLLTRGLMHWAGRSGMPTSPIASITHGTAGRPCATSCQESRLEPLHLTLLVRQLYFYSVVCPRVKRCQSNCAQPP